MSDQPEALRLAELEATLKVERESRGMLIARLDNMTRNGDLWLTVQSVLALINDCDMLAVRNKGATP